VGGDHALFTRHIHRLLMDQQALLPCCWKHFRILFFLIRCISVEVGYFVTGEPFSFFLSLLPKKYSVVLFDFGISISVLILLIYIFYFWPFYKSFICFLLNASIHICHVYFFFNFILIFLIFFSFVEVIFHFNLTLQ
jgi:hypothetical protein